MTKPARQSEIGPRVLVSNTKRHRALDDLRFVVRARHDKGDPLKTCSPAEAVAYALAVTRELIEAYGPIMKHARPGSGAIARLVELQASRMVQGSGEQ